MLLQERLLSSLARTQDKHSLSALAGALNEHSLITLTEGQDEMTFFECS